MSNNFKDKAISGVKWTSLFSMANALLGVGYRLILVSLLAPSEYAYVAVLSLFIGISDLISNLGIGEAVLQRDEVSNKQLSSLYYFEVSISILLAIILFVMAPLIENFYGYNELTSLLRLTSITLFLNGSSSLFRVMLQKTFQFKWVVIGNLIKLISDIVLTISFVLMGLGIYGYVYGTVISTVLYLLFLSYCSFSKTNLKLHLHFNIKDIIPMVKFGFFISAKQIFSFGASKIDEVIIGGFLPAEVLGIYFFAKDFIKKPQSLITLSFSQVMLPVFSKFKNELNRLSNFYKNTSRYIGLIAFPVFAGIAVTAELYVPLLFGNEWIASIVPIQLFSITGILLVLTANFSTSLLYAIDKPNQVFYIEIITNLSYFSLLFLVSRFGMYAIIMSYVMYIFLKTFLLQLLVGKSLGFSMKNYIKSQSNIILFSLVMAISVKVAIEILTFLNLWVALILVILIGAIIYLTLIFIFEKELLKKTITLIK